MQARAALETAVAVHARDQEAAALCRVGDAELALGRHAPAAEAFASAHARASEIASPYRHDASAGLARVALAQGDTGAAMQALEPLLALGAKAGADDNPLEGVEFPRLVEWTCHRVLASAGDPRAAEWLAPRARGASGPGGDHHRRRASPGLSSQHPGSPRDRGGVGYAQRGQSINARHRPEDCVHEAVMFIVLHDAWRPHPASS